MSNDSGEKPSSLKSLRSLIDENLAAVIPEEVQLSISESQDYDKLSSATNLLSLLQDIQERKKFAKWIYWMVVGWLIIILGIIICTGLECLKISDAVILGLIGSTTVNVTAFFVIVTKYLFPNKNST